MYSDTALFTRNTAACPNKLKPIYNAPAPAAPVVHGLPNLLNHTHTLPPNVAQGLNNASNTINTQVDNVVNRIQGLP